MLAQSGLLAIAVCGIVLTPTWSNTFPSAIVSYQPGHTVVSIVGRTSPDDKVSFSGGDRTISVTFNHCSGGLPCQTCTASITVSSGEKSRAEMIACLKEAIVSACPGVTVSCNGDKATSLIIDGTPTDGPDNTGTPDAPKTSPDNDSNKPHGSYYTDPDS